MLEIHRPSRNASDLLDSASIVADHVSLGTENLGSNPGFLGSAVIARKTHAAELSWGVDPAVATVRNYPT